MSDRSACVDESLRPGRYLLGCVVVDAPIAGTLRREVRKLLLPGQRKIHFQDEGSRRRRQLLTQATAMELDVTVYVCVHAMGRGAEEARAECLAALVRELQTTDRSTDLFIESRDGGNDIDRATIIAARRRDPLLNFEHLLPAADPLLWLPDVFAWAVGAGGDWRRRAAPPARVIEVG